ncbi:NAD(P)H-binding protein [Paenibacillus sp. BR2-3]
MVNQKELHVIFGTGPLGKWTMRELLKLNKKVRLVNRSGNKKGFPDEVEVVAGNAFDTKKVAELTKGATAVYQCAQPAYHDWVKSFLLMQQSIMRIPIRGKYVRP